MSVLITTTEGIPGYEIGPIIGVVTTTKVKGSGIFSDWRARMADLWGRKSESYSSEVEKLKKEAITELGRIAESSGADAVVGLKVDVEFINTNSRGGLFLVTVTGTAVKAKRVD